MWYLTSSTILSWEIIRTIGHFLLFWLLHLQLTDYVGFLVGNLGFINYICAILQKAYVKYKVKRTRLKKKSRVDPIRTAFDQMKVYTWCLNLYSYCTVMKILMKQFAPSMNFLCLQRVKNPPIPLKDFASVECMREEINEVVAFLQNPRAFQEMGARAPRVCSYQDNI